MKKDGPVLANVMLDGILPEDLKKPITVEPGVLALERRSTQTVRGKLYYEGTPAPNAYLVFESKPEPGKRAVRADAFAEADGSFAMSTYTAFDGVPAGEYNVTVVWRKPFYTEAGQAGPNLLPDRYAKAATSGLTATVKSGVNEMIFELKK
jgi:hypothetical protein